MTDLPIAKWTELARRDDWHLFLTGSDIRQMLGEIERLRGSHQPCASSEPVAWVIPGDDQADSAGFIWARAFRDGEFSEPLYRATPPRPDREALVAAVRCAKLALFQLRKQGIMPNDSWASGFDADLAKAEAGLAALGSPAGPDREGLHDLMMAATVSSCGLDITIACNDHNVKDALLVVLTEPAREGT